METSCSVLHKACRCRDNTVQCGINEKYLSKKKKKKSARMSMEDLYYLFIFFRHRQMVFLLTTKIFSLSAISSLIGLADSTMRYQSTVFISHFDFLFHGVSTYFPCARGTVTGIPSVDRSHESDDDGCWAAAADSHCSSVGSLSVPSWI